MTDPRKLKTSLSTDIDLDADGKHTGRIRVPYSRDDAAWGSILIPITSIKNGKGPTILLTGGNHGDEYEGQLALLDLSKKLGADEINGQIILLPHMNYPAVISGTRTSPIDKGNMNRLFPGNPQGGVTEKIAHYVATELVPRADIVLDMHSGGKTLDFIPSAVIHHLEDKKIMKASLAAMEAFGAPVSMVLGEDTTGMLDGEVEKLGKIFISTELGGLGTASAERVRIAHQGIVNMLRHFEVLDGSVEKRPTRFMDTPEGRSSVVSYHEGMVDFFVDLGEEIKEGEPLARIWNYQNPEDDPVLYTAPQSGILYARHGPGLIKRGDAIAYVAIGFDPASLGVR